jgi:hypothetical protein
LKGTQGLKMFIISFSGTAVKQSIKHCQPCLILLETTACGVMMMIWRSSLLLVA